jgi:hypothetical protein
VPAPTRATAEATTNEALIPLVNTAWLMLVMAGMAHSPLLRSLARLILARPALRQHNMSESAI